MQITDRLSLTASIPSFARKRSICSGRERQYCPGHAAGRRDGRPDEGSRAPSGPALGCPARQLRPDEAAGSAVASVWAPSRPSDHLERPSQRRRGGAPLNHPQTLPPPAAPRSPCAVRPEASWRWALGLWGMKTAVLREVVRNGTRAGLGCPLDSGGCARGRATGRHTRERTSNVPCAAAKLRFRAAATRWEGPRPRVLGAVILGHPRPQISRV